jgi:8-oxo-dGTP pyrophosphatase MutT (NUDIX family)
VSLHGEAVRLLTGWTAPDPSQDRVRRGYLDHLAAHDDAMWRSCVPSHLTASALVLDPAGDHVLLAFHAKGKFWAQFGGHCEPGDATVAGAALREAVEESGVPGVRLVGAAPVNLDRHPLSAAFGSCGEHLDVQFAAVAPAGAEPVVSAESDAVRWFPYDALPASAVDLVQLVNGARTAVLASQSSDSASPLAAETPSR